VAAESDLDPAEVVPDIHDGVAARVRPVRVPEVYLATAGSRAGAEKIVVGRASHRLQTGSMSQIEYDVWDACTDPAGSTAGFTTPPATSGSVAATS
jgi:hypothetical protein